jgi:2-dehydro-3-deoxygluconokinase
MKPDPSILCYGELLLRLAPPRHELFMQSPELRATIAGAEANVAVALASFGQQVSMLSALPQGFVGDAAIAELRRHGVDTSSIRRRQGRMGVLYLVPGAVRRATEVEYDRKGSCFALEPEIPDLEQELARANWFHVSGVTPALGRNCADATIIAMRQAAAGGKQVSYDGNYRSKLWQGWESEAPAILRAMLDSTTIFMGDERDLSLILNRTFDGDTRPQRSRRATAAAFEAFPRLQAIACTTRTVNAPDDHDYGAHLYLRDAHHEVSPVSLRGIVDRIGTGDAFAAGVIHGMRRGMKPQATLRFAHAAAVLKHSIPGDFLTLDERAVALAADGAVQDVRR